MYVCTYACMYACMHACIYIYIYVHAGVGSSDCVRMFMFLEPSGPELIHAIWPQAWLLQTTRACDPDTMCHG